jgi:transitional endoplasmic reticulum ATPase
MPIDQPAADERLDLTVIEARREDVGRGIVRLDPETLKEIGAVPGDVLEICGRSRTVAKAMPTFKEQRGKQLIQLDGVSRSATGGHEAGGLRSATRGRY